jgi:hypothetical protein
MAPREGDRERYGWPRRSGDQSLTTHSQCDPAVADVVINILKNSARIAEISIVRRYLLGAVVARLGARADQCYFWATHVGADSFRLAPKIHALAAARLFEAL